MLPLTAFVQVLLPAGAVAGTVLHRIPLIAEFDPV